MRRSTFLALSLLAAVFLTTRPAVAQFVDTHNGAATPACCAWDPYQVGWIYTPTTSFVLTSIETRFGLQTCYYIDPNTPSCNYTARTVTAEIRGSPNGSVLGSTSFASSSDPSIWIGGSFAGVSLIAGTSYFVDFLNVGCSVPGFIDCLGVNAVQAPTTGEYGEFWDAFGPGAFSDYGSPYYDPIIRLTGSEVVPEPATMTLLATGLAGMAGAGFRRRRKKT